MSAEGWSTVLTLVVAAVGLQAPAVLILAFVPMMFIAASYYCMNRADRGLRHHVLVVQGLLGATRSTARSTDGLVAGLLVAVFMYGETPLKGAIIGSTARKLLHLSERPVLVVRA